MSFSPTTESAPGVTTSDPVDLDTDGGGMSELRAAIDGAGFPAALDDVLAHLIRTRAPVRVAARVAVLPPMVFADADEVCRSVARVHSTT
ncbi:MAG: hypothetical protein ACRCYR_17090 [Phycicoccus sp.]